MNKLPIYSNNKKTGNRAADILRFTLEEFAIINSHDESRDLGIDMRAQIVENTVPKEMFFNIQCKGTNEIDLNSDNDYFSIPIKVTTINFWSMQNETTFLFLVDLATQNCYWCNPIFQIEERIEELQNQESISIRISKKNCINSNTKSLPIEFINCILLYLVKRTKKIAEITEKIKISIMNGKSLDITQSIQLLEVLMFEVNQIKNNYYEIADALILNIKENLEKSKEVYAQLDYIPCAKQYCRNGIYNETGFSKNRDKSLDNLYVESYRLINLFEQDKDNIEYLKEIEKIEAESLYTYKNSLAFLYEMECEDNPFGDHTQLYELVKKDVYGKK